METKVCSICKEEKPLTKDFFYIRKDYRRKPTKIGWRAECIECRSIINNNYYKSNNKKLIDNQREYRSNNTEKLKQYRRTDAFKQKNNRRRKERRQTDLTFKFECKILRHIKSVEKRTDFKKEWDDVKSIYDMYGIVYHIDHLIPQKWFKPSTPKTIVNDIRNIQVIDAKYNQTKLNRWADAVPSDYFNIAKKYIKAEYIDKIFSNRY